MSILSPSKIFRFSLISFVLGVGIASFFRLDYSWFYWLGLIIIFLIILFWQNKNFCWWVFIVLFVVIGFFRYELSRPQFDQNTIGFYNGSQLTFEAVVIEPPDVRIDHAKLTVKAARLDGQKISGKVLVSTGLYPQRQYGDQLLVTCLLKSPEPFDGFAYDRYLAKSKIYSQCSRPRLKFLESGQANWFLQYIYQFKDKLQATINQNLPEPQASLFSAITLGNRRGVPAEVTESFSRTGTSHLIAISGLHITLIIAILSQLTLGLYISRRQSFWLITIILGLYLVLIGFPPSAVRASVMGWLVMLALNLGRLNRSTNALILVGAVMIFINPKILRDDIGFQLSFCAVLGLIYLSPLFEKMLSKLPSYFGLRQSLQMTLSAQLATLPLIVFNFERVSLIAPVVNILVLPALPYLMIVGFAALFGGLVFSSLSQLLFWPAWLLLSYLIKTIELFAQLPGASFTF